MELYFTAIPAPSILNQIEIVSHKMPIKLNQQVNKPIKVSEMKIDTSLLCLYQFSCRFSSNGPVPKCAC